MQTADVSVPAEVLHGLHQIQDRACTIPAAHDGIDQGSGCGEFRIHVGGLSLHELECPNGLTELVALVDVVKSVVKGGLHDPQRTTGAFVGRS